MLDSSIVFGSSTWDRTREQLIRAAINPLFFNHMSLSSLVRACQESLRLPRRDGTFNSLPFGRRRTVRIG